MRKKHPPGESVVALALQRYDGGYDHLSDPDLDDVMGASPRIVVFAVTFKVTSATTLTITAEDSADGQHWALLGTVLSQSVSSTAGIQRFRAVVSFPHARFLRLRTTLGPGSEVWMVVKAALRHN